MQQQQQRSEDQDAGQQHEQPVFRIEHAEHPDTAAQRFRDRNREAVAAPDHQREVVEDEGDSERQQHLAQLVAAHETQEPLIEREAQKGDGEDCAAPPNRKLPLCTAALKPIYPPAR